MRFLKVARPSTERLVLSGYITSIHTDAVQCLNTLISRCKTLLLPQAKFILSLLVKELLWSHVNVMYGQSKPYSHLRQTVYKTLTLWLQMTQSYTVAMEEDDWLIQEILYDATPHTDSMKVASKQNKKSSAFEPPPAKKKKKEGYSELTHGISSQRKIDEMADSELCFTALETLYCLIDIVGSQLKQKVIEDIQGFVLSVALTFRSRGNYGIPYADERCRHCLLTVMQALNLMPHPTAPSILQYSLSILRFTGQDTSLKVATYSLESLQICEALIHARAPCFHVPKTIVRSRDTDGRGDQSANFNGGHVFSTAPAETTEKFRKRNEESEILTHSEKRNDKSNQKKEKIKGQLGHVAMETDRTSTDVIEITDDKDVIEIADDADSNSSLESDLPKQGSIITESIVVAESPETVEDAGDKNMNNSNVAHCSKDLVQGEDEDMMFVIDTGKVPGNVEKTREEATHVLEKRDDESNKKDGVMICTLVKQKSGDETIKPKVKGLVAMETDRPSTEVFSTDEKKDIEDMLCTFVDAEADQ